MSESTTYTAEFKARAVLDMLTGAKSAADISAEHAIPEAVLNEWRETFIERAPMVFDTKEEAIEAARKIVQKIDPDVKVSLDRSIKENADIWAELAKH